MSLIIKLYQAVPADTWALIFGGSFTSVFAKYLTHVFGINSRKVVIFVVTAISIGLTLAQYALSPAGRDLVNTAVPGAASVLAGAILAYETYVRNAYKFLVDVKQYQALQTTSSNVVTPSVDTASIATDDF
jgi:hypothetical protein